MTTSRDSAPRPGPRRTTAVRRKSQGTPPSPQSELFQEQKYSDHAFRVHRESVAATQEMRNAPSATAADHRAKRKTLAGEAPLTDKDPVAFGWAEDGNGKRFYVGKTSILDESKRALVVNWKSKLGDRYMSAIAGDGQGLAQKRTFTHDAQRILRYSDTHFLDRGLTTADDDVRKLGSGQGAGLGRSDAHESAAFTIDDAVLIAMESHRDSKMHDIVATIQADQYRVLTHDPAAMLLIQGGPGTGKTAVALHRLSWLLYNQRGVLEPADVLVVTPNPTLTRYIRDVLPALGDEGIRQIAIQELTRDLAAVRAREMHEVAALKSDIRFRDVIRQGLRQRIGLSGDRLVFRSKAGRGSAHLDADVVEATYHRYVDLPYLAGRQAFIEQLRAELIDRYPLPRRSTFEDAYDVQHFTAQANRVWPTLSAHRFLHELLGSKRRMVESADQIFSAEEAEKLVRITADSVADEQWTEADTFLLHEIQAQLSPTSLTRFGHIIIDEAQDLSGMQVQAIKRRSRSGAMTLSGDVAQSTGATRRDSWDSLMEILVDQEPGQSWSHEEVTRKTLRFVYRVPREAQVLANALQPEVAPDLDVPESLRESGFAPRYFLAEPENLTASITDVVTGHRRQGLMVGVIAPDQLHSVVANGLKQAGIDFVYARNGDLSDSVTIVSPAGAKGLEFDAVVIVDPRRIHMMDAGARLLYIALTRTTSRVDLVFTDREVPELLRPHVTLPDPPEDDAPAAVIESAESEATSRFTPEHRAENSTEVTSPSSSDRRTHSPREAARRAPTPASPTGAHSAARSGSMEERFIEMSATLYLDEITAQVRPELVDRVVRRMLEKLAAEGSQTSTEL